MTWTKLGDEFSDDMANRGISDAAYRTHAEAIQWLYRVERYDCHVPKSLVRRFAGSDEYELAIKELVGRDMWSDGGDHYVVRHHGDVVRQSLSAQQNKRIQDAERQRRARERKAGVTRDVTRDVASTQTDRQTAPRDEHPSNESEWP